MSYWFVFCNGNILLRKTGSSTYTIPCQEHAPTETDEKTNIINVPSSIEGTGIKTYAIKDHSLIDNPEFEWCGLRQSYYKLSYNLYLKAGKCEELVYWDANTQFCGACGARMEKHTEISKVCTNCGKEVWPQLSIAIIVLVSRGDELLLIHAHNFKYDFYGLVAGFVETGETLEEAVTREVKEETGLKIKNIRYYASQPWPYPSGLMAGFYAEYESGEVTLQYSELKSGGWFNKNNLPRIPEKLSIARQLIDNWLEQH